MALGSGSSLATDCSMRRRGSPSSAQLWRAGLASRLNQVSSKKPTTQSGRPASLARPINRSRRLFSFVLGIWGSDPPLGSLPTHPHPRQRCPDGLSCDALLGQAFLEAHLGGEIHRPQTRVFTELPGILVQKLAQARARPRPVRDPGRPCEQYADVWSLA